MFINLRKGSGRTLQCCMVLTRSYCLMCCVHDFPCFDFPLFYIKCTSRLLKSTFSLSDCIFQCPCRPYQGPKQLSGQFRASQVQPFLKSSAKLSAKWVCPAFSFVRIITFAESNPLYRKQWIELWLIYSGYLPIRHLKKKVIKVGGVILKMEARWKMEMFGASL